MPVLWELIQAPGYQITRSTLLKAQGKGTTAASIWKGIRKSYGSGYVQSFEFDGRFFILDHSSAAEIRAASLAAYARSYVEAGPSRPDEVNNNRFPGRFLLLISNTRTDVPRYLLSL